MRGGQEEVVVAEDMEGPVTEIEDMVEIGTEVPEVIGIGVMEVEMVVGVLEETGVTLEIVAAPGLAVIPEEGEIGGPVGQGLKRTRINVDGLLPGHDELSPN